MSSNFYSIASGVLTSQRNLDVIGNNLVNVRTPGYQADRMIGSAFEQQLLIRMQAAGDTGLKNGVATTSIVDQVLHTDNSGVFEHTDGTYDFALNGEGYFTIASPNGQTYLTRGGQFYMDEEGYLALPGIGRVQGAGGDIALADDRFTVNREGVILDAQGEEVDTLLITAVDDPTTELVKQPNGMFQPAAGVNTRDAETYEVYQGVLERSNVDMNQEMTNLIDAQRMLQSCSTALKIVDQMTQKSVTRIASMT